MAKGLIDQLREQAPLVERGYAAQLMMRAADRIAQLEAALLDSGGDTLTLRALVRNAVREGVAVTKYEEQRIEDAFVRFARAHRERRKARLEGAPT